MGMHRCCTAASWFGVLVCGRVDRYIGGSFIVALTQDLAVLMGAFFLYHIPIFTRSGGFAIHTPPRSANRYDRSFLILARDLSFSRFFFFALTCNLVVLTVLFAIILIRVLVGPLVALNLGQRC
jgi:hypothetical protein